MHPRADPDRPGHRGRERNHGGRPPAVDGDMLAVALRRHDANEPVTSIARHRRRPLPLYRTLPAYDEAVTTGREPESTTDGEPAH